MNEIKIKLTSLWKTTEGRILACGFLLAVGLIVLLTYSAVTNLDMTTTLILVLIAHTFGGRAAGIGLCIFHDFGPALTIGYNFYLEVLIVCFTYAGFVMTTTNYFKNQWINNAMDRLAAKALEQKTKIQSYGWIGIFLFIMAPLPVTGPVIGSIIGHMIRLNLLKNISATLLGTLLAIIFWFYCFEFMEARFHIIQYICGAILIIVLIRYLKTIKNFIMDICCRSKSN